MKFFLLTFFLSLFASAETTFVPQSGQLDLTVNYSFGKHQLRVKKFAGHLSFDEKKNELLAGKIVVELDEIKGDDKKLVCHLRESLGIDYKESDFPESHVCEDNKLPESGKNAIKFNTITAELTEPVLLTSKVLRLKWTIHGVEKILELPFEGVWNEHDKNLSLNSTWKLKRSDFNIVVKKFLFIDAADDIELKLNLKLGAMP